MLFQMLAICTRRQAVLILMASAVGIAGGELFQAVQAQAPQQTKITDLTALIAPELPCYWSAGMAPVVVNHYMRIGPLSAYNSDILVIDEHDGTQWDAPAHFVPKPGSNLPNEGEAGFIFGDKVPVHQFVGEACVIDCSDLLDKGKPGQSPLITKDRVQAWEKQHRPVGAGDVVVFRSGWDKYYKPFPEGRRYLADPLAAKTPGWPDPDPDCIHYLVTRKVMNAVTDAPSMGPLPGEMALATHVAGLRHGIIWTEGAVGLSSLPPTGAFYCMIGPHHANGSGGEGRALAITGEAAPFLIEAARKQRVADLTVLLAEDRPVWWPGAGVGDHRQPYFAKAFRTITAKNPFFAQTHTMDSQTGTHLVPPSYALPRAAFENKTYSTDVQKWLAEYETMFGQRGTSDATTEKVPLSQTCGWARVIDVRHLVGTTDKTMWPASPEITIEEIRRYEAQHGELKPGEIVLFRSGHSDRHFKPFPEGEACIADSLNGKSEGWPAPGAAAIAYLAKKGIRCVGTDGPSLGGASSKQALKTYWSLGSHGMVGVEFLTHLDKLPAKAYFIFAPVKIRDCHGGPGRAIALY